MNRRNALLAWDLIRWRFIAVYHLGWWAVKGFKMDGIAYHTRWQVAKMAWRHHRSCWVARIVQNEKKRLLSLDDFIKTL